MSPLHHCNGRVFDTDKSKTLLVCACRRRVDFGGWLQFLKPPASQPGVSNPRSSESRSLPRPGRCVRSGGSAWLILRLVLRGQLLTTPWTFSTASRLASAQSIAGSLSTCLWPLWSWASVLSWRPCALHSVLAMNRLSWTSFHACLRTVHCYWLVR